MKRFIAVLLLLGGLCSGFIAISLIDPGFGIDEMTHSLMEVFIDPPWVGYGLIAILMFMLALALFRNLRKKDDS